MTTIELSFFSQTEPNLKVKYLLDGLDTQLRILYMKQLLLLREKALKQYKSASKNSESSDYESMIAANALKSPGSMVCPLLKT